MYHIIADLHTHTVASTHAYSTMGELIHVAKEKGLYALGITDHSSMTPGAPGAWFFDGLWQLPVMQNGVKTIMGMEANIIDFNGRLDDKEAKRLDLIIASIHDIPGLELEKPDIEKCTQLYLGVAKNPIVNIIGHSGTPKFAYDYERVIPEFGKNNKLVEINAHTFTVRERNLPNCREIALLCKKHSVPIVVNSDAHYHTEVGELEQALQMLEEISFPAELIVNASTARLEEYLRNHTNMYANRIC